MLAVGLWLGRFVYWFARSYCRVRSRCRVEYLVVIEVELEVVR